MPLVRTPFAIAAWFSLFLALCSGEDACEEAACEAADHRFPMVTDLDEMEFLQVALSPTVHTAHAAPSSTPPPVKDDGLAVAAVSSRKESGSALFSYFNLSRAGPPYTITFLEIRIMWLTVGVLAVALIKLRRSREKKMPEEQSPEEPEMQTLPPSCLQDLKSVQPCEKPGTEMKEQLLPQVPLPSRRLRHIGASFVIPHERIRSCSTSTDVFSFDVPMVPCIWPLHAIFSRKELGSSWEKVELTVDIIKASGLPPLLSCSNSGSYFSEGCEGTGGTGGSGVDRKDGSCGSCSGLESRFEICSGSGVPTASLIVTRDGEGGNYGTVLRPDGASWTLEAHLQDSKPSMVVMKGGKEICQATSLGSDEEEDYLQVDTQPDTQSPESAVLLMSLLVMLAFCQ